MGEFEQYLSGGVHASSVGHEIQLWGTRDYSDVELAGISVHWPDEWDAFNPDGFDSDDKYDPPRSTRLECAHDLASSADVPLIWIGEHNANWRQLDGTAEVGVIENSASGFTANVSAVDIDPNSGGSGRSEMESRLQEIMGTTLDEYDTDKEKNRKILPIQNWVRNNMPEEYVVIDIDLLIGDGDGNARAIVEIRRSDWANGSEGGEPIRHWWPFLTDRRNYYLIADTAERSDTEPVLVQHLPELLNDDSEVGFYTQLAFKSFDWKRIKEYPWYASEEKSQRWLDYEIEYVTASEAASKLRSM